MAKKVEEDRRSFWTTLPGILTGAAAVITALTGVAALLIDRDPPAARDERTVSAAGQATSPSAQVPAPEHAVNVECLNRVFDGISGDRIRAIDLRAADVVVLSADQTKLGSFALELRDAGVTVGGMRLSFDSNAREYTLESLVDATCEQVTNVRNEDMPGADPRTFPSWTAMVFSVEGRSYLISFGYTDGRIEVNRFLPFVR